MNPLPVDLGAALASAVTQEDSPALLWTLPWVVSCMWFRHWDRWHDRASCQAAQMVGALHGCAALQPSSDGFCLGGLMLRGLLDGWRERQGDWLAGLPNQAGVEAKVCALCAVQAQVA